MNYCEKQPKNSPMSFVEWPELHLLEEKAEQERRERLESSDRLSKITIFISIIALIVQILLLIIWK